MADEARHDDSTAGTTDLQAPAPVPPPAPDPWWATPVRMLRWVLGATTLVGGFTWIVLNLHGPSAVLDLAIGTVLTAGGLVLLMPHRIQLPKLTTTVAVVAVGIIGTAAGLARAKSQACCDFAYVVDRGWPFSWAQRGAVADSPEAAYRLAQSGNWTVDLISLSANLLLWAYVGMLLVVIAVLVRRARGDHRGPQG